MFLPPERKQKGRLNTKADAVFHFISILTGTGRCLFHSSESFQKKVVISVIVAGGAELAVSAEK